jgi:type IV secretory pathway TrbL component
MGIFSRKELSKEELVKYTKKYTIMLTILTIVSFFVFPLGGIIVLLATIIWAYRYWQAKKALHGK